MASKSGKSLRELMKGRNITPTPQETHKSKPPVNPPFPPPQLPASLELKPNLELRRKRQQEALEEGEIGPPKGNKQQRKSQDQRSRRSNSVESREDPPVAQVRRPSPYGLLNWRWTVSPSLEILPLDITIGGMQVMLPRL